MSLFDYEPKPQLYAHKHLTLRDHFAAHVATGIAAHTSGPEKRVGETNAQAHARWAYQVADAMLAERAK